MPFHISSMLLLIFSAITLTDYLIFVTGFMPLDFNAFRRTGTEAIPRVAYRRNGIARHVSDSFGIILHGATVWLSAGRSTVGQFLANLTTAYYSYKYTKHTGTYPTTTSGETFKIANEIEEQQRRKGENLELGEKSGRRTDPQPRPTRFTLVDPPSETETKNFTNLKINGYTLKQDILDIMSVVDENITITTIGTTIEYNDIVLVKMSKKPNKYFRALKGENKYVDEESVKKIILIVHGLSPMGFRTIPCLYKVESFQKLVKMYASHLDHVDIFLIPMGNPDGIADESLRIWNKNKSPQQSCPGVNVDRNFDVKWNKSSSSSSCCQHYSGPRPFSERESRAVADLIHHYTHKIIAYIHVHGGTYSSEVFKGDAVLYPKGYTDDLEDSRYIDMEAEIEETMRNAGFKVFGVTMTNMYKWYGKVGGSSVDYATTVYGIPYGLEFVMQPYEDVYNRGSEVIAENVLTEVWNRIINVVFTKIYKGQGKSASSEVEVT